MSHQINSDSSPRAPDHSLSCPLRHKLLVIINHFYKLRNFLLMLIYFVFSKNQSTRIYLFCWFYSEWLEIYVLE